MITVRDAEFHTPVADGPTWAEMNYFGFDVPELRLHEWRCDVRTGLGEAMDFLGMSQITALYNSEAVGT